MSKIKKFLKIIIITFLAVYIFLYIDVSGINTVAIDTVANLIPAARDKFENIDKHINYIIRSSSSKAQKAMKIASSEFSKFKLGARRTLRKAGIHIDTQSKSSGLEKQNIFLYNMNMADSSAIRKKFINYSLSLRGVPYAWGGNDPASGFDCSGFLCYVAKNSIGVQLPRTVAQMYSATVRIRDSEREPGDLVFFQSGGRINHVGIYLGPYHGRELFINAASEGSSTGVIISALDEPYWHYSCTRRFLPSSQDAAAE